MPQDDFWTRFSSVNAGMLMIDGAPRAVPMSHYPDAGTGEVWFMSAEGTDLVEAASGGATATYLVADGGSGIYARLVGPIMQSDDRAKLEEIWNPIASTWYEGGVDDPDLRLLCMKVTGAEAWLTPTSSARFLFEIARSKVTGKTPDLGEHLTFGVI